ncbi:glycosyltransferase family 2 protein [Treponema primitia]|uniref:glycosyltransferase family 2 protein n=1 Tax=Treponema primitia TaxID=88058 RepID=UPI00397FFF1E
MISVVIPVYNEGNAIKNTVIEIRKIFETENINEYEIVLVNDGSTDNTPNEIEDLGCTIVTNPHNIGYGFSLKRGIQKAKYDIIAITDADLTYPFEYIPQFLKEFEKGFDLIVGARTGKNYKESFLKGLLRMLLQGFVEFVAGRKIKDINSGLRVFSKQAVLPFFNRLCNTFSFTTSQTLAYMMNGKFVKYIDIPYHKRAGKSKVKLFKDSVHTMQYIIEAAVYYNPLKIFSAFSVFCILLSIIGFIFSTTLNINVGYYLGIGGLLVSLIIFCIGLLGVLLKQIMDNQK